jgi:hypothetical protein
MTANYGSTVAPGVLAAFRTGAFGSNYMKCISEAEFDPKNSIVRATVVGGFESIATGNVTDGASTVTAFVSGASSALTQVHATQGNQITDATQRVKQAFVDGNCQVFKPELLASGEVARVSDK